MSTQHRLRIPVSDQEHVQGPKSAPLELVEYGDYECPYSGSVYPIIKLLRQRFKNDLRFVYRQFPLEEVHPHAMRAAQAAEAAGLQGKFWEMHGMLFENQENLEDESLLSYAVQIGLNLEKFARDFSSERIIEKVTYDFEGGTRSGVNGTPTFYFNGFRYDGNHSYEAFVQIIELNRGIAAA